MWQGCDPNQYGKNPFVVSYCPPYWQNRQTMKLGYGGACLPREESCRCSYKKSNPYGSYYNLSHRREAFNPMEYAC